MNIVKLLSGLLLGSALSLSIGGLLLYAYNQVPMYLINLTIGAVIVLYVLAYFVSKGKMLAINISSILGVFAPILSASTPAHLGILSDFGQGWLITADGFFQLLGFYVFPIAFVLLRIAYRKRLPRKKAASEIETKKAQELK
ncbi:MAG: hypothetical protein ACRECH_11290 [Nitrososphaerales archaeon]